MKNNNAAMSNGTQLQDYEWAPSAVEVDNGGIHVVPPRKRTQEEELRLEELDDRLQELHAASNLVWFKNGLDNRDPVVDLRTKVESVRWMLRIAKHLKTPAREALFSTIRRSLDQVEHTVEMGVRAAEMCHPHEHPTHA